MFNNKDISIAKLRLKDIPTDKLQRALKFLELKEQLDSKEKLYDTYIKGVSKAIEFNKEPKIYYDFRIDGTATQRLSCAAYTVKVNGKKKSKGVSFHTLPRTKKPNIRGMFIPDYDDWYFITADYKAQELRVLAHVSNDFALKKAFNDGVDLHKYTASLIWGKSMDEISPEERQIAKAVSFLIVYGGTKYKLSSEVNISEDEADDIINGFLGVYPSVPVWMSNVEHFLRRNKYVESLFGVRRNLPNISSPSKKYQQRAIRQAMNFIIQSSSSYITSYAFLNILQNIEDLGLKSMAKATVHDSIEVISPKEEVLDVLSMIRETMMNYPYMRQSIGFECSVPLEVELEVGRSFGSGVPVHFNKNGGVENYEEALNSIL